MPDTPSPKKSGMIGGVKKEYVYAGGAVIAVVLVVAYRSKKAANSTGQMVTDPAGNVCTQLGASGYCVGSAQDLAYGGTGALASAGGGGLAGSNSASYVGGQIIGYDQYGNPIYSSSSTQTGVPGGFTNNAQWTQAAIVSLMNAEPNADSGTLTAALGVYINGVTPTDAQVSIIQQAIALEGFPPVGGNGGYPPSIKSPVATLPVTTPPPTNTPPPDNDHTHDNDQLPAPTGLHVNPSKTTAPVAWNAVPGATGYVFVYWRISGGAAVTAHIPPPATSANMSLLMSKQKYYCYVYAVKGSKAGKHSPAVMFTTK